MERERNSKRERERAGERTYEVTSSPVVTLRKLLEAVIGVCKFHPVCSAKT